MCLGLEKCGFAIQETGRYKDCDLDSDDESFQQIGWSIVQF